IEPTRIGEAFGIIQESLELGISYWESADVECRQRQYSLWRIAFVLMPILKFAAGNLHQVKVGQRQTGCVANDPNAFAVVPTGQSQSPPNGCARLWLRVAFEIGQTRNPF